MKIQEAANIVVIYAATPVGGDDAVVNTPCQAACGGSRGSFARDVSSTRMIEVKGLIGLAAPL